MIGIQWDSKFELGHQKIDFEHQIFLDLIRTASELEDDPERALRILSEIKKYAEFHFISEENVMIDAHYPEYLEHKDEHKRLLAALTEQNFQYMHNQLTLDEVVEFLFQWFALHTTQVDAKLAEYIRNNS